MPVFVGDRQRLCTDLVLRNRKEASPMARSRRTVVYGFLKHTLSHSLFHSCRTVSVGHPETQLIQLIPEIKVVRSLWYYGDGKTDLLLFFIFLVLALACQQTQKNSLSTYDIELSRHFLVQCAVVDLFPWTCMYSFGSPFGSLLSTHPGKNLHSCQYFGNLVLICVIN